MVIEEWAIDPQLKQELDAHYKTAYALSLRDKGPMDIVTALTFDGLTPNITVADIVRFLENLNKVFVGGKMRGVGVEIGSGPGTFVAGLANLSSVQQVYGIEACESIPRTLSQKVVSHIARENSEKVTIAIGDFNHVELEDNTVDFVLDFFSLHHSEEPLKTLTELHRVLKPGGIIICIDKARANRMTEKELDALLDIQYSSETKIAMGLPPGKFHDRRMNGEHEYRLKDWNTYFTQVGFSPIEHYNVAKIGGNPWVVAVKRVLSKLHPKIQVIFSRYITRRIINNLEPTNRIFTDIFPQYPREFSLMISQKKS